MSESSLQEPPVNQKFRVHIDFVKSTTKPSSSDLINHADEKDSNELLLRAITFQPKLFSLQIDL